MKKRQLIIQIFIFILVFAIFAFLRFYNLNKRIIFDWDQEQFSFQIKNIIINHKLTLIGPRVVNDKGFFLAPYFTYLLIPFYLVNNLHPQGLIYFLILLNCLFFFSTFLMIKRIFGSFQAILFLFLWSINPLLIVYDTIPWWPVTIPLGAIITWFNLFHLYKKNSIINWITTGLILGLFLNMHFQFIFIFFFSCLFLLIYLKNKKILPLKKIFAFAFSFFIIFTPLIIFDLRHNFLNTNNFINFFFSKNNAVGNDRQVWLTVFNYFLQPLIFFRSITITKIFYFFIFLITIYLYRTKKKFLKNFYLATIILWLSFPVFFTLYGQRPSEYYFVFLYPFILIIIADFFLSIKQLPIIIIFGTLILFINSKQIINNLQSNIFGLYYKDKAIRKLKRLIENKKFNISFDTPLGTNFGYNYLINYYDIKQTGNWNDPLVEIRIPPKKDDIVIGAIGLKIPQELK